jgi:tetratricopeptide (TPR) repeat protein
MLEAYYGLLTKPGADVGGIPSLRQCVEALEVFPLDAQLLCALGGYLHARGQAQLALQAYSTAYRFGQVEPTVWHVADIRDVAAVCYSVALQLADRKAESSEFLEEAVRERPESARIRRRLIEIYIEQGDREAAVTHVGLLAKGSPHVESLRSAVRGACYAAQRNWIAAKAYLNAAYGHGCRDVLLLKWLAITLTACGESVAARPILEQWSAADPRNPDPARLLAGPLIPPTSPTPADPRTVRVDPAASRPVFPFTFTGPIRSGTPAE